MSGPSDFQPTNPALKWIERRLPIMGLMHSSFVAYPTPRNLNYWWTFGGILATLNHIVTCDGSYVRRLAHVELGWVDGDDTADFDQLEAWVDEVIAEKPVEAQRFLAGETKLQGVLVGLVMKKSKGRADQRRGNFKEKKGNLKDLLK